MYNWNATVTAGTPVTLDNAALDALYPNFRRNLSSNIELQKIHTIQSFGDILQVEVSMDGTNFSSEPNLQDDIKVIEATGIKALKFTVSSGSATVTVSGVK